MSVDRAASCLVALASVLVLASTLSGCAAVPSAASVPSTGAVAAATPAASVANAPNAAASAPAASSRSAAASDVGPLAAASAPAGTPSGRPPAECLQVLDRLSQGIPRDETGPVLRSKGLRIASPIQVPEGALSNPSIVSGARVRMMIDRQGRVVPGSVIVQQAVGDPGLPLALTDAAPATLSFDVSGAFSLPPQFAFTTVYVSCARN